MLAITKSLKGRLAAYFAVSIIISLLISGLLSVGLVQRYLKQRTISDLKTQAEALAGQIEVEGLPQRRYVRDLERVQEINVLIVAADEVGGSFKSQQGGPAGPGGPGQEVELSPRPEGLIDWKRLEQGETQVTETKLPGVDRETVSAIHGFERSGGELAGAVILAKPLQNLQPWRPLALEFLVAAAIALAISLLLAFLLARRLSEPLHEITLAATAVAAGDFSSELNADSEDEIGRLADAFRFMSDEVQKSQQQQKDFVMNVSHELKTPLTAIAGHVQALRDGIITDPGAAARSLEVVGAETRRLSRLIEDLLSLAKFDASRFELRSGMVPLEELLESVADGFAGEARDAGISLAVDCQPELQLTTDPDRLRQILSNLINNAISHTPAQGRVEVSCRQSGAEALIEVADTGQGISEEELPHVFDRFYRAGKGTRGAGLGLGLAISAELARAMGGEISASSAEGQGSTFTVSLPLEAGKKA